MEINFNEVSYIYNEGLPISNKAIDNISLTLKENKIYGVIGTSGSGKTTFLQLINNLLIPSNGNITINNFILKKNNKITNINDLRKNIGFVFQFPEEQFFETTVEKEISFALNNFNYKKDKMKEQIINVLKMLGLNESYLDKNPFLLSNGEKRKIAIASILVYNPKILIFDEPTIGLDYKNKKALIELIRKLNTKYKKTIIIVSHDVDMLYSLVDDIIIMEKGKIIANNNKKEVFKNITFLENHKISIPKIVLFSRKVLEKKNIKLGDYEDIKDLIKAVYRNV